MKPQTKLLVVPTVPDLPLNELTDFFLGLSWVLEHRSCEVTEIEGDRQKLYLSPLNSPIGFQQGDRPFSVRACDASVATHVLRFLTKRLVKDRDLHNPEHLFLKVLSPELQVILRDPHFGDGTPLMAEFLQGADRYFVFKRAALGRPYWSVKTMYAMRAHSYIQNKSRWARNIPRALYRGHQKLQNVNTQLGLGLVSMPFHLSS